MVALARKLHKNVVLLPGTISQFSISSISLTTSAFTLRNVNILRDREVLIIGEHNEASEIKCNST